MLCDRRIVIGSHVLSIESRIRIIDHCVEILGGDNEDPEGRIFFCVVDGVFTFQGLLATFSARPVHSWHVSRACNRTVELHTLITSVMD